MTITANCIIKIDIYCATCKERFRSQQLAMKHVEETGHVVSFAGTIVKKD